MRTAWKILAGAGVLLVVVVVGVAVTLSTVDVNALLGPVKDRVKAATGRDLNVNGGASLALSLQPKLVLRDVTLSNAPWGSTPQMLTAQRLELEVALLPLLRRRFELVEIAVVGPVITLETDGHGQRNWESGPPASGPPGAGSAEGATTIGVGNVAVTGGMLTYRNGTSGAVTHVAIDRLSLRARSATMPVAAEFRGKVDDVAVAVEGTLGPVEDLLQKHWPYPVSLNGEVAGQKTAFDGKVRADGSRYAIDDLALKFGGNALTGTFAVATGGPRPAVTFDLAGAAIVLDQVPVPAAGAAAAPKAAAAGFFPDTPVQFARLRSVDADGKLALASLQLADGRRLANLRVALKLDGGRLHVPSASVGAWGGVVTGSLTVDASDPAVTAITVNADGKGLELGALLATIGQQREVRGGKSDLSVRLAMRGASPRAWAGSATGHVQLVVGQATLVNTKIDLASTLDRITAAVNPFREREPSTELVCAVIRLPLANGIAKIDRSVAMETSQLGVAASGTLDFRDETLDFTFQPRVRKGIPVEIPNLAELVRVSGPFASPQVKVDAVGSVKAIASIGAAVGTAGLSAVGQALFAWSEGNGAGPCQIALGAGGDNKGAPAATGGRKGDAPPSGAGEIGKAIGRLFGK